MDEDENFATMVAVCPYTYTLGAFISDFPTYLRSECVNEHREIEKLEIVNRFDLVPAARYRDTWRERRFTAARPVATSATPRCLERWGTFCKEHQAVRDVMVKRSRE